MLNPTAPGEIIFLSSLFNQGSGPDQDECQLKRNKVYLDDSGQVIVKAHSIGDMVVIFILFHFLVFAA